MSKRFVVVSAATAHARGWHTAANETSTNPLNTDLTDPDDVGDADDCELCSIGGNWGDGDDEVYHLYDTGATPVPRLVGWEGGEPEDQSFSRNLCWIPLELNKLSSEYQALIDANRRLMESYLLTIEQLRGGDRRD